MPKRAVFLDRDGVINQMVYNAEFGTVDSPANPDEFVMMPMAGDTVAGFNRLGFCVIVVSNQPGIAKGRFTHALLEATTQKMHELIQEAGGKIDAVYHCLHHPEALLPDYRSICNCRKPKPGLLFQAAEELDIDLRRSFMVGDGIVDMHAGKAAGTTTILLSSLKCYDCAELARQGVQPDYLVADLAQALQVIRRLETTDRPPRHIISGNSGIS